MIIKYFGVYDHVSLSRTVIIIVSVVGSRILLQTTTSISIYCNLGCLHFRTWRVSSCCACRVIAIYGFSFLNLQASSS